MKRISIAVLNCVIIGYVALVISSFVHAFFFEDSSAKEVNANLDVGLSCLVCMLVVGVARAFAGRGYLGTAWAILGLNFIGFYLTCILIAG